MIAAAASLALWASAGPLGAQPALGPAADTRAPRDPARAEPWQRRERQAVPIEQTAAELAAHRGLAEDQPPPQAHVMPLPEAHRLGLRPLPLRGTAPASWPAEPPSPGHVDAARFAGALAGLCPKGNPHVLADAILSAATEFDVDPFLLAGVAYQQSLCDAQRADAYGIGLTRIQPSMFQRGMQHGSYRYGKPDGHGGFTPAELALPRYPFTPAALRSPKVNAYFAAALLSVLKTQCPAIDKPFGSQPHRHFVSHFVWGDHVRTSLPEDEILVARRRLLYYYSPFSVVPRTQLGMLALSSPLDAPPRVVIGVMGEPRDNGKRPHRGIDLAAGEGEPVRAMADGIVTFAGVDLREQGLLPLESRRAEHVAPGAMGPRGLFVRVQHQDGIETLYVHLASYVVHEGQSVQRGQQLGVVGRSGVHASDAHLHLGVFVDGQPIDPLPALQPYAVRATQLKPKECGDPSCVEPGERGASQRARRAAPLATGTTWPAPVVMRRAQPGMHRERVRPRKGGPPPYFQHSGAAKTETEPGTRRDVIR